MLDNFINFLESNSILASLVILITKMILIIVIGLLIVKILTKYISRYLDKIDTQHSRTIRTVLLSFIRYMTYFFMFTAILSLFGVNVLSIMAIAGIGSVAIGFGAQTFVKDLITGAFILLEEQYQVDDYVVINNFSGRVEEIGLRTTRLRNVDNNEVYIIPNGEIKIVTNKTKDYQKALVNLKVEFVDDISKLSDLVANSFKQLDNDERLISKVMTSVHASSTDPIVEVKVSCYTENNEMVSITNELADILSEVLHKNGYKQVFKNPLSYIQ